jgi:hypothetical protein
MDVPTASRNGPLRTWTYLILGKMARLGVTICAMGGSPRPGLNSRDIACFFTPVNFPEGKMRGTSDAKTGDMTRQERLDRAEEITLWKAEDLIHRAVKAPEQERAKLARCLILLARRYHKFAQ